MTDTGGPVYIGLNFPILKKPWHLDRKKLRGKKECVNCPLLPCPPPGGTIKHTPLTGVDMSRVPSSVVLLEQHCIVDNKSGPRRACPAPLQIPAPFSLGGFLQTSGCFLSFKLGVVIYFTDYHKD